MSTLRDHVESVAALRSAVQRAALGCGAAVLDATPLQALVADRPPALRLRWRDAQGRDGHAQLVAHAGQPFGWSAAEPVPAWLQAAIRPNTLDQCREQLQPVRQPLTWEQACAWLDPYERALLGPWQQALQRWAGQPVQWFLQEHPVRAVVLTLPPVPAERATQVPLLLAAPELWSQPALAAWLGQLGFGLGPDGACSTVPTPASFARLVAATLDRPPALLPRLIRSHVRVLPPRQWLDHLCAGEVPIGHGTAAWYRLTAPTRSALGLQVPSFKTMWHGHFAAVGHDMAVHALLCHRLDAEVQREAAAQMRAVLAKLHVAVEFLTPGPLLAFWEEDLHQYALRCLRDTADVAGFDHLLRARLPLLNERLQRRLQQTEARVRHGLYRGRKHMGDPPMT